MLILVFYNPVRRPSCRRRVGKASAILRTAQHREHITPHTPVRNSFPNWFNLFTAMIVETAALNFLLALNLLNSCRLAPKSFLAKEASSPLIHKFSRASLASILFFGSTVNREEIRSFASAETVPQYSSWNSYSPLLIFRNKSRCVLSMKGGYPPKRM